MKVLLAAAIAITAFGSAATVADAHSMHGRRHVHICKMHNHHRVCHVVRR